MKIALGTLSPDGQYYWDGSQWVSRNPLEALPQVDQQPDNPPPAPQLLPSSAPHSAPPHTIPISARRRVAWQLFRMAVAGLVAALVVSFLVTNSLDQWMRANSKLAAHASEQQAQLAAEQQQVDALQGEVQALKQR